MPKLSDFVPTNLESEKIKFFASNFTYNPQFSYQRAISLEELQKYGKPKWWYLFLAKRILKKYLKTRGSTTTNEADKLFLDQESIKNAIQERLTFYEIQHEYEIIFSTNFISRIAVNNKEKIIKVRLPITISANEIKAILNHEIDTHIVRQLNYEKQNWFRNKKKNAFKAYLQTEEGLAAINELVASKHKLAYKSAANYLAVDLALKKDFASVFNFFYQIWGDRERAWTWTLKKKRGLTDTSQKGAFTKDLVYFEGLIEVLKYLKKNNNDPSELYYGKINLKDIRKAKKLDDRQQLILPKCFVTKPEIYKQEIQAIIRNNLF